MSELAQKIDQALHDIVLESENQLEILVGSCKSEIVLTNTQEHILMLIEESALTSSEIAKKLNVSQAAITKAVKSLISKGMLVSERDAKDGRIVHYKLTEIAKPIALEHAHHHHETLEAYDHLLSHYSKDEQAVIGRFLQDLVGKIKEV